MSTTVKKVDILSVAASLLGPEADKDSGHPEYERAIVEMVIDLVGGNSDDKEAMAMLLRAIAE